MVALYIRTDDIYAISVALVNRLMLVAAAVLVVLGTTIYLLLPTMFPPSTLDLPYRGGYEALGPSGTCTYATFSLYRPALLTGAFVANESTTFFVVDGAQKFEANGGCLDPGQYEFTTGSTMGSKVNFTLVAGTYTAAFVFGNGTNGPTQAAQLTVTQGFVAHFRAVTGTPGEECVSLSCFSHGRGPQGPDGTY